MKEKRIEIRVDDAFLEMLEYLRRVHGYRSVAETIRRLIEKEYRKEHDLGSR